MTVESGTEAVQFPEKEYVNWIFVAVLCPIIVFMFISPPGNVRTCTLPINYTLFSFVYEEDAGAFLTI